MRAHWRYLKYVLRHKWFVLVAGWRLGAPLWRLVIHDWSKFLPGEWGPYATYFYAPKPRTEPYPTDMQAMFGARHTEPADAAATLAARKEAFDGAWNLHQKRNPHHWQFWLLMEDTPPKYPKYHITSRDGGLVHHALTEYTRPYDGKEPHPVQFDLLGLEDNGQDETQARYAMARRLCDAANARRPVPLPMPEPFILEMVADWMGAGRAITGRWEVREWYASNRDNMVLHPETRARVEALLSQIPEGGQVWGEAA